MKSFGALGGALGTVGKNCAPDVATATAPQFVFSLSDGVIGNLFYLYGAKVRRGDAASYI